MNGFLSERRRLRRERPGRSLRRSSFVPRLALTIVALGASACYETPKPACSFVCGENQACPSGYVCGAANRCRLPDVSDRECGGSPDAAPIDAAIDAAVDAPTNPVLCANLAPGDDGSGRQQLVIAEVAPDQFLELFNPTDTEILLADQQWGAQAGDGTVLFATEAPTTKIPAHGYATVPWPAVLKAEPASGELALYVGVSQADDFEVAENLVGYVCWGEVAPPRKALAETAGKWSEACAPALTATAIRRLVSTAGTAAADFTSDVTADPTNCMP